MRKAGAGARSGELSEGRLGREEVEIGGLQIQAGGPRKYHGLKGRGKRWKKLASTEAACLHPRSLSWPPLRAFAAGRLLRQPGCGPEDASRTGGGVPRFRCSRCHANGWGARKERGAPSQPPGLGAVGGRSIRLSGDDSRGGSRQGRVAREREPRERRSAEKSLPSQRSVTQLLWDGKRQRRLESRWGRRVRVGSVFSPPSASSAESYRWSGQRGPGDD